MPQKQPIKEENKHSFSKENPPEKHITPIEEREEINVPLIPSNQFGLLRKPSASTLNNSDVMRFLYISNLILYFEKKQKQLKQGKTRVHLAEDDESLPNRLDFEPPFPQRSTTAFKPLWDSK